MTSQIGYLKLLISRSILSVLLDLEIKRVACIFFFWPYRCISSSYFFSDPILPTGRGSSIGSEFAWHASGPEFDPHVQHILSWRLGHENISMAILPLLLIQEEQLSVTGERMCTKYW